MDNLTVDTKLNDIGIEVEIKSQAKKGWEKVKAEDAEKHKAYVSACMADASKEVNTDGLDDSRTYMACAIAYDQKYKTSYAPCIPGVGCIY